MDDDRIPSRVSSRGSQQDLSASGKKRRKGPRWGLLVVGVVLAVAGFNGEFGSRGGMSVQQHYQFCG